MSDTKKSKNAAVACGKIATEKKARGFEIVLDNATYGPSRNEITQLAGMEINAEDSIFTNDTKDGKTQVIDKKTGKVIGILEADGTVSRKLAKLDRERHQEDQAR